MKKLFSIVLILSTPLLFTQELLDTVVVSAAAYQQSLLSVWTET